MTGQCFSVEFVANDLTFARKAARVFEQLCLDTVDEDELQILEMPNWQDRRTQWPDEHPGCGLDSEDDIQVSAVRVTGFQAAADTDWASRLACISLEYPEVTVLWAYCQYATDDGIAEYSVFDQGEVTSCDTVAAADDFDLFVKVSKIWTGFVVADR